MRIAVVQAAGTPGDPTANLTEVRRRATEAAAAGAQLVVFPEAFVTGYAIGADAIAALAEPLDGPGVTELRDIARVTGTGILCGYCELADGAIHNSAVLIGSDGSILANARKTHLFGTLDSGAFRPGTELVSAVLDGVRVGILICYDLEFPEAVRRLALDGARLIAVPTALMHPDQVVADVLVPARAVENQVFVAYANRVGDEGSLRYVGSSCVAGPRGSIVRADGDSETVLHAECDFTAIDRARAVQSYLHDRRPDLYGS